jgi:hypothetical protein
MSRLVALFVILLLLLIQSPDPLLLVLLSIVRQKHGKGGMDGRGSFYSFISHLTLLYGRETAAHMREGHPAAHLY